MSAAGVFRAEWTKFTSIRSTMVLSPAIVVVSALIGWWFADAAAHEYATATPQERLDFSPILMGMRGMLIVQLLVSALGALVATSEYGSGTMGPSLAAVGRRGRLMAAKAGMTVVTVLPVSVAGVWLMFVTSQSGLAAGGAPYVLPGDPAALVTLLAGPLLLTLVGLFGLALGLLLRGTAAAVNVGTAFLLLPVLASDSTDFVNVLLSTYWPNAAALAAVFGDSDLPGVLSYGLLVGFVAVMQVAAFTGFTRRDA
ncbi:hypothetical protein GCM10009733_080900 [Nonomuraea maheshkhaliensis]|uniref:ABC transporter permease n=1 Tax=Nonomuraea maheshkhaliensis TaxID=419590 RepID=A0ABN2GHT0_9ACTN